MKSLLCKKEFFYKRYFAVGLFKKISSKALFKGISLVKTFLHDE